MRNAQGCGKGIAACILFAAVCSAAAGQSPDAPTPPAATVFAAADVHPSPHSTDVWFRGGLLHGDRYQLHEASMVDLVARAYGVDAQQVLGGPAWLERDRFEIFAKAPADTPEEAQRLMLHALLAERFHLATHPGTKPLPAFVLSLGKGKPKLKEPDPSADPGCKFQDPPRDAKPGNVKYSTVSCHAITMEKFAKFLHESAEPYLTNPVVDATGLKGAWDFDYHWSWQPPKPGGDGISIFDAVDKQLGLKLEAGKAPLPVVFVDTVDRKPTPNAPGLDKLLPPPPPAEFEVAIIKPTDPDSKDTQISLGANQVTVRGATLQLLISFAWDLDDSMITGYPPAFEKDRFDILGKIASNGNAKSMQIDFDDFKIMMRSLLADRFKLKTHMEDRPIDTYILTGSAAKLKKADPTNRTSCKEGPGPDGKDPRITSPMLSRLVSCLNVTMAEFAEQLPTLASGFIHMPVFDSTGLEGNYDFTLSFSTSRYLRTSRGADSGPSSGELPSAADPSGGLTVFEALNKQLGLKLEKQKRPAPVLVVDHVESKPTDN